MDLNRMLETYTNGFIAILDAAARSPQQPLPTSVQLAATSVTGTSISSGALAVTRSSGVDLLPTTGLDSMANGANNVGVVPVSTSQVIAHLNAAAAAASGIMTTSMQSPTAAGAATSLRRAAIYLSQPSYQQTPLYRHRRCNDEEDDAGEFGNVKRRRRNLVQQQMRGSKPGDKCTVCLDEMAEENMHEMECGHALHKECFEEYRYLRRNCPLCSQTVNPSLPGDNCTICLDPLNRDDMVFLRCQHAMHQLCYKQFIDSGAKVCSLCRKGL